MRLLKLTDKDTGKLFLLNSNAVESIMQHGGETWIYIMGSSKTWTVDESMEDIIEQLN